MKHKKVPPLDMEVMTPIKLMLSVVLWVYFRALKNTMLLNCT